MTVDARRVTLRTLPRHVVFLWVVKREDASDSIDRIGF